MCVTLSLYYNTFFLLLMFCHGFFPLNAQASQGILTSLYARVLASHNQ